MSTFVGAPAEDPAMAPMIIPMMIATPTVTNPIQSETRARR